MQITTAPEGTKILFLIPVLVTDRRVVDFEPGVHIAKVEATSYEEALTLAHHYCNVMRHATTNACYTHGLPSNIEQLHDMRDVMAKAKWQRAWTDFEFNNICEGRQPWDDGLRGEARCNNCANKAPEVCPLCALMNEHCRTVRYAPKDPV